MLRIVDEVRPSFVFAENSPNLRTKGLATIVERFIRMGYVGRVGVLGARDIGANHERKRMWIVAISKSIGCRQGRPGRLATGTEGQQELPFSISNVANADRETLREQQGWSGREDGKGTPVAGITDWWSVPRFAGVDDGMANRMDRVKATGNGQVAGVAALVWSLLTSDLWSVNLSGNEERAWRDRNCERSG
jgi:DNA (cytosine-5)-methyltransferase 1